MKACLNCEHFTQSLCCNKRRIANRKKVVKVCIEEPQSTLMAKENLNLILRRIEKLETDDKEKNESLHLVEIKADYDEDDQEKTKFFVNDEDVICQISLATKVWKSAKY